MKHIHLFEHKYIIFIQVKKEEFDRINITKLIIFSLKAVFYNNSSTKLISILHIQFYSNKPEQQKNAEKSFTFCLFGLKKPFILVT